MNNYLPQKLFLFSLLMFCSCNVVQWQQEKSVKILANRSVQEAYFETDSLRLHYFEGGEGPVVVFIHGFGADALASWSRYLYKYSKEYRVIALDVLWFGESSAQIEPNLENQVSAVMQLLDHLEVDTYSVVGQSYGGFISYGLALKDSARLKKMCIANCPGVTYDVSLLEDICIENDLEHISDLFVFDSEVDLKRFYEMLFYRHTYVPDWLFKRVRNKYFSANSVQKKQLMHSLPLDQSKYRKVQIDSSLERIVIWADEDKLFPLSEGEKLAKYLNCDLYNIPKSGHVAHIERYRAFSAILDKFLKDEK